MVSAFLDDPAFYEYGMSFARMLIISGPILGVLFVMINAIQSMGAALPSLILSISRQGLIYIPILFLFSAVFGTANMLVIAQPVADYVSTTMAIVLFIISFRKYFVDKEVNS